MRSAEGRNKIFFLKAEGSVNCSNGRYLATEVGGDRANQSMLLPLRKEDRGKSMKVRFLTDSGSTSNPIEGLLGSDKVALLRNQCCVSSANPKLSNGSIPSNPNQQQSASSKAKKVSTVDRYSVSKQGGEAVSKDQLRILRI